MCEFNRELPVPSGSENLMLDLNSPVHVLYAAGAYSTSDFDYHGADAFITNEKINFKSPIAMPVCLFLLF